MKRDDFPFRNVHSPRSHKLCTDPLCLVCLISERDDYQPHRHWPRPTQPRLYIVRRLQEKTQLENGGRTTHDTGVAVTPSVSP